VEIKAGLLQLRIKRKAKTLKDMLWIPVTILMTIIFKIITMFMLPINQIKCTQRIMNQKRLRVENHIQNQTSSSKLLIAIYLGLRITTGSQRENVCIANEQKI
jgi:inner membrane protein involved in colicin E2 resistance